MPCKTIDQPESLINVDSKKTNGNISEVPMEEDDLCAQASKAIIGLKGKKDQNLGCKTTIDKPESLINVDAKKTNDDTSEVPMEEEPCTQTPFSLPNGVENIDAERYLI